ncbi:uncharacterized protein LOC141821909 [Curcuma longa]|uniref:uncharacterized protein LOC141821909 n=1 Tax=Curcuma longa TaxID=136217 RepID=UPI003D9E42B5
MANPGPSSWTRGDETLIRASKIGFLLLCVLSAGAAGRVAVPAAAEALAVALPGYRAALRSWLAPPYLFVAVHLIIFVIWKLSDQKQQDREQWAAEARMVDSGKPKSSNFLGSPPVSGLLGKPSPYTWRPEMPPSSTAAAVLAPDPVESSPSDASCLTTDSDEVRAVSSAVTGKKASEEEDEAAAGEIANESMEAAWKAITENTPRSPAMSRRKASQPAEAPSSSATPDEFNQRIDDFIKKTHEQLRLLNGRGRRP